MMIGYFSVFSAFRCAMFYMSFLSHLLKKLSKRPAVEPSDFWENRTRFQKQRFFLFCIFTFAFFIFFHIFVNFRLPLPTPLAQIGLICGRFWFHFCSVLVEVGERSRFLKLFGTHAANKTNTHTHTTTPQPHNPTTQHATLAKNSQKTNEEFAKNWHCK